MSNSRRVPESHEPAAVCVYGINVGTRRIRSGTGIGANACEGLEIFIRRGTSADFWRPETDRESALSAII